MPRPVLVVGAGMGGLAAALRLARRGFRVRVLEARQETGGLASGLERGGFAFDAGPYILLDRPGLEWAFRKLGLELEEHVRLRRLDPVYEVLDESGDPVRFFASAEQTAGELDRRWPGSGSRYRAFVQGMTRTYARLSALQREPHPGPARLLRSGAWRAAPFLLRSLESVLRATRLPEPVVQALGIWTHVAGQELSHAPSPLAFVPALFHTTGAFYAVGGIGTLPRALERVCREAGVEIDYGTRVRAIRHERGRVTGVETDGDGFLGADVVFSNAAGVGTYLELLQPALPAVKRRLGRLPLQSPGVCAYLVVRGQPGRSYLQFNRRQGELCRLFIQPAVPDPSLLREGWHPARLLSPMRHAEAEAMSREEQRAHLERLLAESWWRSGVDEYRVLETRVPADWGREFHLHRDSMNPVMTAQLMRAGRLAHRSPHVRGLYLAGSATHPGQWVSFCAISGLLAADLAAGDLA